MAVGVAVSVSKVAVYSRMTEVNSFYARVVADGGTISDFSALRLAVVDYKAVQSLEPSLYTFASGRKAGVQYSLVPADGSGDLSVTRSGDTAMELNANGFWQPVAANVPRYDYVSGRPMLNIEELRTNLLPRYKTFPHSDWTKSGARIEGDPTTAGAEKVTNGGFDTDTGWNKEVNVSGNNWVISDGVSKYTSVVTTGTQTRIWQTINVSSGKLLKIQIATTGVGRYAILCSTTATIPNDPFIPFETRSGGTYIFYVTTTTEVNSIGISASQLSGSFNVDNFSIKEVTGYASPFVDSSGNNLMDGYKLVATANNGYIRLATAVTVTAATTYSNSIWIKRVTGTGQAYIIDTNTTDRAITLTTEWQRFEYAAAAGSTSGQIGVKLAVAGDEVLIAHAQLEAGATASSPIGGVEGSAQSRNADVIASAVDYSNIKTLVINNDAYVVETALPNNGYTLPQLDINKLAMFTNTLTDEQITAAGWTKKVLAFAVSVNIAAGTTVSIEVNGVGTIEWGDGTSDSYSSQVTKTHVYAGGYKGLILFTGTLTRFSTNSNANWYFNIADAPANLTYLQIAGSNTITGNIANAPANLTFLYITGSNTITGNIANAPANLTILYILGSNTITGNIANAPANLNALYIAGSNTITGNIANAPANLTTFIIAGSNTLADYTAGRVWKTNYNYLSLRQAAGAGLSSTEVDNLLIDLAATTWGGSGRTLDIKGVNAARTSASDAAVLSLQAQSVTVLTN